MNLYHCTFDGIFHIGIALVRARDEADALRNLAIALIDTGCFVTENSTAELVNLPENETLFLWNGDY